MTITREFRSSALLLAWTVAVLWAWRSGYDPGYWDMYDPRVNYPWRGVLAVIALITGEFLILAAILRPWSYERHWRRAAAATGAWLLLAVLDGATFMTDLPGYGYVNGGVLLLGLVALLLLTLLSFVAASLHERRPRGPTDVGAALEETDP